MTMKSLKAQIYKLSTTELKPVMERNHYWLKKNMTFTNMEKN